MYMSMTKGGDRNATMTSLKGIKRMNLNVPTELHRAFKTATSAQGKEMTEVLLHFIEEYVSKHAPAMQPSKKGGRS
jgi:hypothetical protein